MVKLSPSILSADFRKLEEQIRRVDKAGAEFIHIDVMDGQFVPNISFGCPILKAVKGVTDKVLDVHLMIEEPDRFIDDFIAAGADLITIHYEADKHIDRTINYIKSNGVKAGIALNPGTPVSVLKNLINIVDMVLIMSVNPGFGGQKFIPYTIDKLSELKEMAEERNKDLLIQVDGGVGIDNAAEIIEAGANVLVAGSAVFKDDKIEENIAAMKGVF
ncbi:ribulose-phosphate 3-epimerase [Inconstantimicrobium porci]|uniref:Ribulose-phosphate 3-epimerase n=1 Tax=Inconstantimicrobium porci TaxID=2652291 RepID=A0A7X2MW16_9CLOT|nr:ribulose-phosphate 3-epimerase [Inconstantimicrobium porci]MDD6772131.1 ribulose-phosphate 3-epimerase [Inconstantimicrobium porci]MSR90112.1 ribulose-phosphate 3-epimerase [Inconstantimicrobium porci]